MKRILLARSNNIATRQRVYRIADGLEVDEIDHFEVRRSRVLYEDVILVTYHRYRGALFLGITGALIVLFGALSIGVGLNEPEAGLVFAGISVLPLLLLFALRLAFGVDEINVYSRRSKASLRFMFRKAHARTLMREITAAVRRRQQAVARTIAPPAPPAPPPPSEITQPA